MNKLSEAMETQEQCSPNPHPLADQLREKRARLARKMTTELKKLDRQIQLLEGSDAESIVRESEKILYEEMA